MKEKLESSHQKLVGGRTVGLIGAWVQAIPFTILLFWTLAFFNSREDVQAFLFAESILLGTATSVAGGVMLFVSVAFYKYRARWIFWVIIVYGIYCALKFSFIYFVLGISLLTYCTFKRSEFTDQ